MRKRNKECDIMYDINSVSTDTSSDSFSHWFKDRSPGKTIKEDWEAIQKTLHDEPDCNITNPAILQECKLWRETFPHMRVKGCRINVPPVPDDVQADYAEEIIAIDSGIENTSQENKTVQTFKPNFLALVKEKREKIKSQVVGHIVKQITAKLGSSNKNITLKPKILEHHPVEMERTMAEDGGKKRISKNERVMTNVRFDFNESGYLKNYSKNNSKLTPDKEKIVDKLSPKQVMEKCNITARNTTALSNKSPGSKNSVKDEQRSVSKENLDSKTSGTENVNRESPYSFLLKYNFDEEKEQPKLKSILKSPKQVPKTPEKYQTRENGGSKVRLTLNENPETNLLEVYEAKFDKKTNKESYFERGKKEVDRTIENKNSKLPKMDFDNNNWMKVSKNAQEIDFDEMFDLDYKILKKYGKVNTLSSLDLKRNINGYVNCNRIINEGYKIEIQKLKTDNFLKERTKIPNTNLHAKGSHERNVKSFKKPEVSNKKNMNSVKCKDVKPKTKRSINNKAKIEQGQKISLPPLTNGVINIEFNQTMKSSPSSKLHK